MRSYCIVVTQAKHLGEFHMYLNARCPIARATFIKLSNLAYTVCKLTKSIFFVQSIKDRLQNKETFELQCVWCNHHFNNIGAIDYNVITLYVQIMYTVPSWEFLSPIFLSTSTSESSSKSEAFTKKKKI